MPETEFFNTKLARPVSVTVTLSVTDCRLRIGQGNSSKNLTRAMRRQMPVSLNGVPFQPGGLRAGSVEQGLWACLGTALQVLLNSPG
jgi:hypothetical protein